MPRKLKVYQTSQGFFDLAVAAPTMKAALAAWGASPDLFRQGFAKQSEDKDVIAAAMAQPGVVLRRPVGTNKRFTEKAELPTAESLSEHFKRAAAHHKKPAAPKAAEVDKQAERDVAKEEKRKATAKADEKAERRAAAAVAKEERKRELQRQKKEAADARARARRDGAIKKAIAALENARREHHEKAALIERERDLVEARAKEEKIRWQKLESRLESALEKARR
jgi:colicin import membrane protein